MSAALADLKYSSPLAGWAAKHAWIKWVVALTVALSAIRVVADVNILSVSLRFMAGNLSATRAQIDLLIGAYAIASVVGFAVTASFDGWFGVKRGFLVSLIVFTAASVLCGLAANAGSVFIASRILQGLGGGALLATAISILFQMFSAKRQMAVQIVFGIASLILGPVLGPAFGGYLADNFSWRWIFHLNLPLGLLAGILTFVLIPADEAQRRSARPDWTGIALTTAGLGTWNYFFASQVW